MKTFYLILSLISLFSILPVEQHFGILYISIPLTLLFIFYYLALKTA